MSVKPRTGSLFSVFALGVVEVVSLARAVSSEVRKRRRERLDRKLHRLGFVRKSDIHALSEIAIRNRSAQERLETRLSVLEREICHGHAKVRKPQTSQDDA